MVFGRTCSPAAFFGRPPPLACFFIAPHEKGADRPPPFRGTRKGPSRELFVRKPFVHASRKLRIDQNSQYTMALGGVSPGPKNQKPENPQYTTQPQSGVFFFLVTVFRVTVLHSGHASRGPSPQAVYCRTSAPAMPASAGAGCASTAPTRDVQPALVHAQSRCRATLERQPDDRERRASPPRSAPREFTRGSLQFTAGGGIHACAPGFIRAT